MVCQSVDLSVCRSAILDGLLQVKSVTLDEVTCLTLAHQPAEVEVKVSSSGVVFPTAKFEYSASYTPTISSVSPNIGSAGQAITLTGLVTSYGIAAQCPAQPSWSCVLLLLLRPAIGWCDKHSAG